MLSAGGARLAGCRPRSALRRSPRAPASGRARRPRGARPRAGVALLCVPAIALRRRCCRRPRRRSPTPRARGNLLGPLEPAAGGRDLARRRLPLRPRRGARSPYPLIAVALRRRGRRARVVGARGASPGRSLYVLGAPRGCAALVAFGSPWVDGKALATASPAIPFAAMLGVAGWRRRGGRRASPAAVAVGRSPAASLWSNALGYRDVEPRAARPARRARADRRADRRAGADADDRVPALRRAPLPPRRATPRGSRSSAGSRSRCATGARSPKGESADTDAHRPGGARVLPDARRCAARRRRAARRRLPADLARRLLRGLAAPGGDRRRSLARIAARRRRRPVRRARTAARARARRRRGDLLVAATGPVIELPLASTYPSVGGAGLGLVPSRAAPAIEAQVERAGTAATYEVWLGGSLRPAAPSCRSTASPPARSATSSTTRGGYVRLGVGRARPRRPPIELRIDGADLHPGSAGDAGRDRAAGAELDRRRRRRGWSAFPAGRRAAALRSAWDWIEVAPVSGERPRLAARGARGRRRARARRLARSSCSRCPRSTASSTSR